MARVWNERTKAWTDEELGTLSVTDWLPSELEKVPHPGDGYKDYVESIKEELDVEAGLYKLQSDPSSRRCVAHVLSVPWMDFWPCLSLVQFMVRGDRLVVFYYWRSSSDLERDADEQFEQWMAYRVMRSLDEAGTSLGMATIYSFRASDHVVESPHGVSREVVSRGAVPEVVGPVAVAGEGGGGAVEPGAPGGAEGAAGPGGPGEGPGAGGRPGPAADSPDVRRGGGVGWD